MTLHSFVVIFVAFFFSLLKTLFEYCLLLTGAAVATASTADNNKSLRLEHQFIRTYTYLWRVTNLNCQRTNKMFIHILNSRFFHHRIRARAYISFVLILILLKYYSPFGIVAAPRCIVRTLTVYDCANNIILSFNINPNDTLHVLHFLSSIKHHTYPNVKCLLKHGHFRIECIKTHIEITLLSCNMFINFILAKFFKSYNLK